MVNGAMLWNFSGENTQQLFNSWNTAVKLTWSCPRDTRSYLVQEVLSCGLDSAQCDILTRYAKFFNSLRTSPSIEVATVANIASRDVRTTTGSNLRLISQVSGLDVWSTTPKKLRERIRASMVVPVERVNIWRIEYLDKLLAQRQELAYLGLSTEKEKVQDLISSLCRN